jgi:hypothetical protein
MSITIAPGRGILSGVTLDSEKAEKERAAELAKEKDYAERLAAYEAKLREISVYLVSLLGSQLQAESAQPVITPEIKRDFARFQKRCELEGLCSLPASPEAAAEHLIIEADNAAHAERLAGSISTIHRAMNLPDPTADVLVKAAIRWFRENEVKPEPKKARKSKKGTN